jgi:hypothetical protein
MKTILLAALPFLLQADPLDSLVRFPKGTTWKYQVAIKQEERKYSGEQAWEVVEAGDGKIRIRNKTTQRAGELETTQEETFDWSLKEGVLSWNAIQLHKAGARKGDAWKTRGFLGEEAEARHEGTSEVKVPAGTYKEAILIQLKADKSEYRVFLVPKVGMVRLDWTFDGGTSTHELISTSAR